MGVRRESIMGNEFWKLRSKHGRDRLISNPKLLLEAAYEYFAWCYENPLHVIDFRGKDIQEVQLPKPRVFQKSGLARYVGVSKWETIKSLKSVSKDFLETIETIETIIYEQKFEGASVGIFNPSIMARDLKLADNITSALTVKDITKASDKELEEEYKKLNTIVG